MSVDVADLGTILGVWAHPDDEAFLSAGLMAQARRNGQRVAVVTATRGEQGTPDAVKWPPPRMARRREEELEASLATLGVDEHLLLGFPDGGCAEVPLQTALAPISAAVAAVEPDTILTFGPDGYTGHRDHRAVSSWVDHAVRTTGSGARVLHATASAEYLAEFDPIHTAYDVFFAGRPAATPVSDMAVHLNLAGDLLDRKVMALTAQASQTAGLIAGMGLPVFRQWVSAESFVDATAGLWNRVSRAGGRRVA